MPESPPSSTPLAALRHKVARIEGLRSHATSRTPIGHPQIDAMLAGGLARARLHEVFAAEEGDAASAAGFSALLMLQAARPASPLVWLRLEEAEVRGGRLHAPGLRELGVDPGRLVIGVLPDPLSLLRVAAEVTRCADVGATVIELWRNPRPLDLTASRRLAAAAEESGVTALLLRVAAEEAPSAAATRWHVRAAPSAPLDADAPGHPAFDIHLVRQRGGRAGGRWRVEWDRDRRFFRDGFRPGEEALPGAGLPAAGDRPVGEDRHRPG